MPRCRSCSARIQWAKTVNDKSMPVDYDQAEDGNVRLDNVGGVLTATVLGPLERLLATDVPLYMPHHATCPDAESWHR